MMENKLKELNEIMEDINPHTWDSIPDIDLYIDQVLDYMKRQHPGLKMNESLTSSMINNYAKQGLLPRAKGKKYNREHIACLTIICLLKQITSVSDTKLLLGNMLKDSDYHSLYEKYIDLFDDEAENLRNFLSVEANNSNDNSDIYKVIMKMAITSYLYKFACQYLITNLEEGDVSDEK